jgi:ABC-type antimicrobial peptide transport system permease subunit
MLHDLRQVLRALLLAVGDRLRGALRNHGVQCRARTNEIGLRMTLGAKRRRLIWMAPREVCVMATVGLAIGLLVAAAVAPGYGPAWRASRIEPWTALRHE